MATYRKDTFDGWQLLVRTGQTLPELTDVFSSDTGVNLFYDNFRQLYNISDVSEVVGKDSGVFTLNRGNSDLDITVKAKEGTNLVYTDASENFVGIGTATPSQKLNIRGGNLRVSDKLHSAFSKRISMSEDLSLVPTAQNYLIQYFDTSVDSAATTLLLKDGIAGQIVNLYIARKIGGSGTADSAYHLLRVKPESPVGYEYIDMNTTGQSVTLQFLNGKWFILSLGGKTGSLPAPVGNCCSGQIDLCDSGEVPETPIVSYYTLIDCDDSSYIFTTTTDLSLYVGKQIAIESDGVSGISQVPRVGDSTKCWEVFEGPAFHLSRCHQTEQPSIAFVTRTDLTDYVGKWVRLADNPLTNSDSTNGSWYVQLY